jgi:hypothetical protein
MAVERDKAVLKLIEYLKIKTVHPNPDYGMQTSLYGEKNGSLKSKFGVLKKMRLNF